MTTPEEIAARREAFEDDDDNCRPDYPAAVKTIVTAVRDLAAVERERDELRAEVYEWRFTAHEERRRAEKAERGAKTLGEIVDKQCQMVLDATGLHDWVDEDGDGDWGAIWDHLSALRPRAEKAEAIVARVEALREKVRAEGIACECGHTLDEHNGLGCYARLSYTPLVACECKLTDDRTHEDLLEPLLRAALEGGGDE